MHADEIKARVALGYEQAQHDQATELKPFGQTSEDVYPYTFWWVKGYNQFVEEQTAPKKAKKSAAS